MPVLLKHSLKSLNHHRQSISINTPAVTGHSQCIRPGPRGSSNDQSISKPSHSKAEMPRNANAYEFQEQRSKAKQDPLFATLKEITGLLNKLSYSNKYKIFSSIVQIFNRQHPYSKTLSDELLADFKIEFVDLLYDKAVMEPPFVDLYSQLCFTLTKELPDLSGVVMRKCQFHYEKYFVTDSSLLNEITDQLEQVKRARYVNDREVTELLEERVPIEYLLKAKVLGNLRFVGSLILYSVIPPAVASTITKQLCQNFQKPLAVEGLVTLWTKLSETAGINDYIETVVVKYISEFSCSAVLPLRERDMCTEWIILFNKLKKAQERSSFSQDVRTPKSDSSQDDENTDQESSSDSAYYVSVSESDSSVSDCCDSSA
ncbi:hypothetical protein GEMRC1_001101 [Eukaryota sp. GEM-RC1]